MGGYVAKQMSESVEEKFKGRGDEIIGNFQRKTMSGQFHAQALANNKQMAMQIAKARETLNWTGSFAAIAVTGLLIGFIKTKNKALLAPAFTLSYGVAYQAHMAYGNKLPLIRAEAERILQEEKHLLGLPLGPVTYDEVVKSIKDADGL